MNANPSQQLAIGISARALFDLHAEEEVLRKHGAEAHRRHQLEQAEQPLPAGPGLPVLQALLHCDRPADRGIELVVLSEGVADLSLRVLSAARKESLEVNRAAFTGGESLAPYLHALRVDLFLSADPDEAAQAMEAGTAAALVRSDPEETESPSVTRIAVDGRAVALATEEGGVEAEVTRLPVPRWIRALAALQRLGASGASPILTALVCCEEPSVCERVLRSLGEWGIELDQAFFTGSAAKADVLDVYRPHVVFEVPSPRPTESLHEVAESNHSQQRSRFRLRA
jgi:5'-nucleotidase